MYLYSDHDPILQTENCPSDELAKAGYIEHDRPKGESPWEAGTAPQLALTLCPPPNTGHGLKGAAVWRSGRPGEGQQAGNSCSPTHQLEPATASAFSYVQSTEFCASVAAGTKEAVGSSPKSERDFSSSSYPQSICRWLLHHQPRMQHHSKAWKSAQKKPQSTIS